MNDMKGNFTNTALELFDNMHVAIEVYRGYKKGALIPIYCNESYLKLMGISKEKYFEKKKEDLFFGIYKDDIKGIKDAFDSSIEDLKPFSYTHRLLIQDGKCVWVTTNGNFSKNDDGSLVFYVYIDHSDEITTLRKNREERFRIISNNLEKDKQEKDLIIKVNFTKDIYETIKNNLNFEYSISTYGNCKTLFDVIETNIEYNSFKELFKKEFDKSSLIRDIYNYNERMIEIPLKENGKIVTFYLLSINLFISPKTRDVEGIITLLNIDKEYRERKSMERIFSSGFDMVAHIDASTGLIFFVRCDDIEANKEGENIDYEKASLEFVKNNIADDYYNDAIEAFKLNKIREEIEKKSVYSFSFPLKTTSGSEVICQWRFGYILGQKRIILSTRTNISKYLDEKVDALTGLYNQKGFTEAVRHELDRNYDREYQILRLDFDGFKLINDEYGYNGGNRFLRMMAKGIKDKLSQLTEEVIMARFDADHFLFFVPVDGINVDKIYSIVNSCVDESEQYSTITARIGVYRIYDTSLDIVVMCDRALLAVKSIKGDFSKHIEYYNVEIRKKAIEEKILASEFDDAIQNEEFELWFQPQVNHLKGELIGAEALVRWRSSERGFISPASFIPVFEKTGLIYELDKYVLSKACEFIRMLIDNKYKVMPISVNISRFDLFKIDFIDSITEIINKYNVPLEYIHLEITESAFSESSGVITKIVNKLLDLGFTIAIDDFGSGYSSLSMIKNVPAQILKLDMSFFESSTHKERNDYVIKSIVKMAKLLKMSVIAEGVENKEEAKFLKSNGCYLIQGYLYSKPLSKDDFLKYSQSIKCEPLLETKSFKTVDNDYNEAIKFYENIINQIDNNIIICDAKTKKVLFANDKAEKEYKKIFDINTNLTCYQYKYNSLVECESCPLKSMTSNKHEFTEVKDDIEYSNKIVKTNVNGKEVFSIFHSRKTSIEDKYVATKKVIENIPAALAVFKEIAPFKYKRIFLNEKAQDVLGMKVHPNKQTSLEDSFKIVVKEDIERLRQNITNSIKRRIKLHDEVRIITESGSHRWIQINASSLRDVDGKLLYYCIFTDISDKKSKEASDNKEQMERYEIYQKMITEPKNDDNEELLERIELDLDEKIIKSSIAMNNDAYSYQDVSFNDLVFNIANKAFSANDRKLVIEKLDFKYDINDLNEKGYTSKSIEYLRVSKSGKISFVRTEIKVFIEPFISHVTSLILTFEVGKMKFPETLLNRFISKELEIISLYNLKSKVGQSYFIRRGYHTIDRIFNDQIFDIEDFAHKRIESNKQNSFLEAVSLETVKKHLNTIEDTYRCSFWAYYDDEKRRKTWTFSYIDEGKEGMFITRADTTSSYIEEEKEKTKLENALQMLEKSNYDGLTGLLNRSASISKIEELILEKTRMLRALLMIDLDNLKYINDSFGHLIGDKALALLSEVLRKECEDGIIGRVGGDEFIVYYNNITSEKKMIEKLNLLLKKINEVKILDNNYLNCSIGCIIDAEKTNTFEWMYRRADRALYVAKRNGKNCFNIYKHTKD